MPGAIGVARRAIGVGSFWGSLYGFRKPPGTLLIELQGTALAAQRNDIVQQALDRGADWLLFVDDDHLFPEDVLLRLLAHERPIVGACYFTRNAPYRTTAMRHHPDKPGQYQSLGPQDWGDELLPVDVLGMGCTLIRRPVLEAIGHPWYRASPTGTEDTFFCERAAACGFPLWLDMSLRIGHFMQAVIWMQGHDTVRIADEQDYRRSPEAAPRRITDGDPNRRDAPAA